MVDRVHWLLDAAPSGKGRLVLPMSTSSSRFSPSEVLIRPQPGIARGRWEVPAWVLWAVAVGALVGGLVFVALSLRKMLKDR